MKKTNDTRNFQYWRERYGTNRSDDFIEGVLAGVEAFAVWTDGVQTVGVIKRPLNQAIKEIITELSPEPQSIQIKDPNRIDE